MTIFRRQIMQRRQQLALRLLWLSNETAQEHYRQIIINLANSERE